MEEITLRAVHGGPHFVLIRNGSDQMSSSRWIPSGQYEIEAMVGDRKTVLPPIAVDSGRIVDLGGLRWFDVGGYERVLLQFDHDEFRRTLSETIAKNRNALKSAEPILWRLPEPPAPRPVEGGPPVNLGLVGYLIDAYAKDVNKPSVRKLLRETRSISEFLDIAHSSALPTRNEPTLDAAGNLLFPADLGQIRVRSPKGEWRAIDTGTTAPITSVLAINAVLLAGSARGEIRVSHDGGLTWKKLVNLASGNAVIDIDFVANRVIVLSTKIEDGPSPDSISVSNLNVYVATRVDLTDLNLVKSFVPKPSVTFPLQIGLRGQALGAHYYLNTGSSLERLNPATLEWTTLNVGHDISIFRASGHDSVFLTAALRKGLFASTASVSDDSGQNWRSLEPLPGQIDDIFVENLNSARASIWNTGMFVSHIVFYKYDAVKRTWTKDIEAPPDACRRTLGNVDSTEFFCLSRAGSIFRLGKRGLIAEFVAD